MFAVGRPLRCNWCRGVKPLVQGKNFCADCAVRGRECAYCHRPMPSKYYGLDFRRCNACYRKYQRQLAQRRNRKCVGTHKQQQQQRQMM